MVGQGRKRNGQTCSGQSDKWDLGADTGPRDRKGVAFCFRMQLLAAASTSKLLRRVSGLRIVQLACKVS